MNLRQTAMDAVHAKIFGEWLKKRNQKPVAVPQPLGLADSDILERAFKAKTGAALHALYRGDISAYRSTSEADFGLAKQILFWVAGDLIQADRIFRSSRLFRPKWDERHGALTYGQMTLANALKGVGEFYSPQANPGEPGSGDSGGWLSIEEIDALLGTDTSEPFRTVRERNVADTVVPTKSLNQSQGGNYIGQ